MTIGNAVAFGCIRLVNDDVVDRYGRVQVSTPVVVNQTTGAFLPISRS
jgi:lipoprotein-anchoring transpeptidase ErfK/SrfK